MPSSLVIGPVTYKFSPNDYGLNQTNSGNPPGDTTIGALITEAAVPEPVSIGLLYGSALGLGLLIRRRVAK